MPGVELFAAPLLSCTMGGSVGMGGCWLLGRVTVGVCTGGVSQRGKKGGCQIRRPAVWEINGYHHLVVA